MCTHAHTHIFHKIQVVLYKLFTIFIFPPIFSTENIFQCHYVFFYSLILMSMLCSIKPMSFIYLTNLLLGDIYVISNALLLHTERPRKCFFCYMCAC